MQRMIFKQTGFALSLIALALPALAVADQACIELGALVYTKWYHTDAGGPGKLPAGETKDDMLRCKACHGYDLLGKNGSNAAQVRKASSPNSDIEGDGTLSTTNLSTGPLGNHAPITAQMVWHAGTGRSVASGSGSWVELTKPRTASNTLAYQMGYTLGNQHPDYTGVLTERQVQCVVEFLNSPDAQPDKIYKRILTDAKPVVIQLVDSADAKAGKVAYENECVACHNSAIEPAATSTALDSPKGDAMVTYLTRTTGYAELAHKGRWGITNSKMTRKAMGNPSAQDMADILKYLESLNKTVPLQDKCGKSSASVINAASAKEMKLHIPSVNVATATGDVKYWATLRFAPELSPTGKMAFELTDAATNSGTCK
ncbi:MAG: cytochrome c [Methylococcaceae bacterium]|nr:cytochrome c [Methylococcaceae bacterium]